MWPHFLNLASRTWSALMAKASTSTFGFILFSIAVPIVVGVLAAFWAYLKDRRERKLSRSQIMRVGIESAVVSLAAVLVVVGITYFVFFIPTIYNLHVSQQQQIVSLTQENKLLSTDIQDRKINIRIYEPAYEHIKVIYSMYAGFRRVIGDKTACEIKITAPTDSGTSNPIIRQIADPAGVAAKCAAFGPMIASMDPTVEPEAINGMEPKTLIIHTRENQPGSLALYDAIAPYIRVKRSFTMPKNSPNVLIWFQFGKDVQWLR